MPAQIPENLPPIAVIDIGTNSVHLIIARLDSRGNFTILDSDKAVLRLGDALTPTKHLTLEAIARTTATVRHMKEIAAVYNPIYRAVATHATRVARNHHELLQAIAAETGIQVALIDGVEEARLASLGMHHGLSLADKTFLGVDIGGGSTEIIIAHKESIRFVTSIQLGSVMLSKKHLRHIPLKRRHITDLANAVAFSLAAVAAEGPQHPYDCAVVCSGAAKTLAMMHARTKNEEKLSDPNGYQLTQEDITVLTAEIHSLGSADKIKERWHLDSNRAEIILAGATILNQISRIFRVRKWLVSTYGLREGLVIDTLSRLQSHGDANPLLNDVRWKNILHLGERYRLDREQSQQVASIALSLYDQLRQQKFAATAATTAATALLSDREALRAAAWLHESGKFINFSRYHRHSFYLIINSRLMGYSQKERYFIGLIARFHRKGKAQKKDYDCHDLTASELARLNFLAAILRLAVAANRSRQGLITGVLLTKQDSGLALMVENKGSLPPEVDLAQMAKEKTALEESLGLTISIGLSSQPGILL